MVITGVVCTSANLNGLVGSWIMEGPCYSRLYYHLFLDNRETAWDKPGWSQGGLETVA